jgi:hypothetical protein
MELKAKKIIQRMVVARSVAGKRTGQVLKGTMCNMIHSLQLGGFSKSSFDSYYVLVLPNGTFDLGFNVLRKQRIHGCTYLGVIPAEKGSKEAWDDSIYSGCIGMADTVLQYDSTAAGTRPIGE